MEAEGRANPRDVEPSEVDSYFTTVMTGALHAQLFEVNLEPPRLPFERFPLRRANTWQVGQGRRTRKSIR
jgi:hypothetical protein